MGMRKRLSVMLVATVRLRLGPRVEGSLMFAPDPVYLLHPGKGVRRWRKIC